ncbi:TetR family transcriptional regulator [candidate division KSB1 bacterium]|nr:TetR family transcriptional regulator [candidate division KSB1 bacterium]NIR69200.1 TetR family transcriptional regulator [candidate division KSB1 bacterium]NIS27377.1 TetR family transcriptional regulator [candidate division KSB1 bacterium]NIT74202.1 TetR family transcriptional regulator [candidate division KSB1 bacterium]NIU28094.1 TetR family transcriptional regulator [candidate division KSB1 bacterium]
MMHSSNNRKDQIVFAALEIISEEGAKKLTMKKIAEKIGISDAALYRHFKNKRQIMQAMIEKVGQSLTGSISTAVANIENPVEKLREILRIHLSYLENNKGIPRLVFSEEVHQNDPMLRSSVLRMVNHYLDLIRGILVRARETGQIRSDIDVEATAIGFLGLVQAMALLWSLSGFQFEISEKAPALWRVFSESLK